MYSSLYPKKVCDYQNESEYVDHGDSRALWSWEFIRRNPRYQELTDKVRFADDRGKQNSAMENLDREYYPWLSHWQDPLPEWSDEPDWCPGIMQGGNAPWNVLHSGTNVYSENIRPSLRDRLIDVMERKEARDGGGSDLLEGYVFDLSIPLESQLADVEKRLMERQKNLGLYERIGKTGNRIKRKIMQKPKGEFGVRWLRILDGVAVNAKPTHIQRAIGLQDRDPNYYKLKANAIERRDASPPKLLGYLFRE